MIVGHVGAAFMAKRYRPAVSMSAVFLASFAPDIARAVLLVAGVRRGETNVYTHALPWCIVFAAICGIVAWWRSRDRTAVAVVVMLVLSHVLLDALSGKKRLWDGGPRGADLSAAWQGELAVEGVLLWGGWWFLRVVTVEWRWIRSSAILTLLTLLQYIWMMHAISQRPWKERCLSHPIVACGDGSWLTASWMIPAWLIEQDAPTNEDP